MELLLDGQKTKRYHSLTYFKGKLASEVIGNGHEYYAKGLTITAPQNTKEMPQGKDIFSLF